jgi:phytoene synthase
MVAGGGAEGGGGAPEAPWGPADEVAAIARAGEPDRYLAALLAPPSEREALLGLAAFAAELARIPLRVVREPIMGEIRLEWWRKALLSPGEAAAGHRVADAVRAAVQRYALPSALLEQALDAHALELAAAPFPDDAAVDDFLWRTEGVLFALAGRVTGLEGGSGEAEDAFRAAGLAYGLVRVLLSLPRSLSLGRVPLAETQIAAAGLSGHELLAGVSDARVEALMQAHFARVRGSLAQARRLIRRLPQGMRIGFLPLALVEPYVQVLQHLGGGALRQEAQVLPLRRVWRITAAHLFGRL